MNIFIHEIFQLQYSSQIIALSKEITLTCLNESAPIGEERILLATYFFTSANKIIEWSKRAQPGDVLYISTENHAMMMYVTSHRNGSTIVGFYEPNSPNRSEVLQIYADFLRQDIESRVFCATYHNKNYYSPVVGCEHIASRGSNCKKIEILNDYLNIQQLKAMFFNSIIRNDLNGMQWIIEKSKNYSNFNINDKEEVNIDPKYPTQPQPAEAGWLMV